MPFDLTPDNRPYLVGPNPLDPDDWSDGTVEIPTLPDREYESLVSSLFGSCASYVSAIANIAPDDPYAPYAEPIRRMETVLQPIIPTARTLDEELERLRSPGYRTPHEMDVE